MLQHVLGVPDDALQELMLAGGFGNYLSIRSAVRIGLIPALAPERIRYVGNAAALGAQLALVSEAGAGPGRAARPIHRAPIAGDAPGLPGPLRGGDELPEGVTPPPARPWAQRPTLKRKWQISPSCTG